MEYRFLQQEDFSQIHSTFIEAFSDYVVKMQPSAEQFRKMLTRRGVRYDLSVGAYSGQQMVGFNLNGLDLWRGRLTVYDTGTGVIPEFRGQAIAAQIFAFSLPQLKQIAAQQYLLEVIDTNAAAISVYKKVGFRTVRRLQSFRLSGGVTNQPAAATTGIELRIESNPDWEQLQRFWDWEPSWHNSVSSMKRSLDNKVLICAFSEGSCVGYGIVYPATGDIPQLAIHKGYRRRGIGTQILQHLAAQIRSGQSGRMINIDATTATGLRFYQAVGMEKLVNQHEMLLDLNQSA